MAALVDDVIASVDRAYALALAEGDDAAKAYVAACRRECVAAEAVVLTRLSRSVDRLLGPGRSVLSALATLHRGLAEALHGAEVIFAPSRLIGAGRAERERIALAADALLADIAGVRADLAKVLPEQAREALKAPLTQEAKRAGRAHEAVDPAEIEKAMKTALDEFEAMVKQRRKAVLSGEDAAFAEAAAVAREQAKTARMLQEGADAPVTAVGYAFASINRTAEEIGRLAADLRRRFVGALKDGPLAHTLPLISQDSLVFARAVGIMLNLKRKIGKAKAWALVSKASSFADMERALAMLSKHDAASLNGFLNQFRGFLPEEAAETLGVIEALGRKHALELLSDVGHQLGDVAVETLKGPFWIKDGRFWKEFGDGAVILRGGGNEAYLVALGESKAYLPSELFDQLFKRSDGRMDQAMHYIDEAGEFRSLFLKSPPGTTQPLYIFSRPTAAASPRTQAEFERTMTEHALDQREVLALDLPFTKAENDDVAWTLFREAVKMAQTLR